MAPDVRVGVGVFVCNDKSQFIMGQRKGSHGAGTWALPGGHLDFGESFENCAVREVLEETGLHVYAADVRFLTATNDIMLDERKHYVTIFVQCRIDTANATNGNELQPKVMEPEKCERWDWVDWKDMRLWATNQRDPNKSDTTNDRRLFMPLLSLLDQRPDIHL